MKAKLKVSNQAELVDVPQRIIRYIERAMTLPNPKYQEAVKHGRWRV